MKAEIREFKAWLWLKTIGKIYFFVISRHKRKNLKIN